MSHPPETSRQLAERIWVCADDHSLADDYPERWKEKAAALIDAWVRVREIEAKLSSVRWFLDQTSVDSRGEAQMIAYPEIAKLESALATARKQLEGKL